jgi:hypothetical protein
MAGTTLKAQPKRVKAKQPGMGGYIWVALLDQFNIIQQPPPTGTGTVAGDEALITATHTFITTGITAPSVNGFIKIPLIPSKSGKFGFKSEGEYPAEKTVADIEAMAVGLDRVQVEMIKRMKGQNVLMLMQDAECDNPVIWQIGCDCKPVDSMKFEFSSDNNELKITGKAECILNEYQGAITLMVP